MLLSRIPVNNCFRILFLALLLQEEDIERTIGIDTDYIESTDFALEKEDKDFLIEVLYTFSFKYRKLDTVHQKLYKPFSIGNAIS